MLIALSVVVGLVAATVHLLLSREPRTRARVIDTLLVYSLAFQVGVVGLLLGFIPHVFFADRTAESIGWPTGSPFQLEVGIHDGAWGVLGFLCIWIRGGFRVATGLGWAMFMLGAAAGHVYQALVHGDFAEYNFWMIFVDGFVAVFLPLLLYLDWRWNPGSASATPEK